MCEKCHTPEFDDRDADWEHWLLGNRRRRVALATEPRAETSEATPPWTPDEQSLLDHFARDFGRPLDKQEEHLIIEQARGIGSV